MCLCRSQEQWAEREFELTSKQRELRQVLRPLTSRAGLGATSLTPCCSQLQAISLCELNCCVEWYSLLQPAGWPVLELRRAGDDDELSACCCCTTVGARGGG